eukprot:scaffold12605_cov114-Isochrysis_galbana.AAC.13
MSSGASDASISLRIQQAANDPECRHPTWTQQHRARTVGGAHRTLWPPHVLDPSAPLHTMAAHAATWRAISSPTCRGGRSGTSGKSAGKDIAAFAGGRGGRRPKMRAVASVFLRVRDLSHYHKRVRDLSH